MSKQWLALAIFATLPTFTTQVMAQDNQLTPEERKEGWILLFDGKSDANWMTSTWQKCPEVVDEGTLNPSKCPKLGAGGWDMVYERPWTDFVLELDFKISPKTNSGVMVRISPLQALPGWDVEYNGLEVQILDSTTAGYHDTGSIYDLVKPTANTMKPVGQWNHLRVKCDKNLIDVWLNGTQVNHMDLDEWTQPNRRLDGSETKFNVAWRYHSRTGYIGLQKHGGDCWFKNIKLKPLG